MATILFASCAQTQGHISSKKDEALKIPVGIQGKPSGKEAVATFAEALFAVSVDIVFTPFE